MEDEREGKRREKEDGWVLRCAVRERNANGICSQPIAQSGTPAHSAVDTAAHPIEIDRHRHALPYPAALSPQRRALSRQRSHPLRHRSPSQATRSTVRNARASARRPSSSPRPARSPSAALLRSRRSHRYPTSAHPSARATRLPSESLEVTSPPRPAPCISMFVSTTRTCPPFARSQRRLPLERALGPSSESRPPGPVRPAPARILMAAPLSPVPARCPRPRSSSRFFSGPQACVATPNAIYARPLLSRVSRRCPRASSHADA